MEVQESWPFMKAQVLSPITLVVRSGARDSEGDYEAMSSITVNESGKIVLAEVYEEIVIHTPTGDFSVAQRDGGLEVVHDGRVVYVSLHQHRDDGSNNGDE